MRIVELRAENFKRLRAVRIRPDRSLVQIVGRNAQGKSSVLDAVWVALGGKDAAPDKPVRDGAASSIVYLDLGDLRITRKFSAEGRTTLAVESADGLRYPSPQAVLDELVGRLTFDPLAFSRMDGKRQAQTLRDLVGIDTSKLDAERKRLFDQRTDINRELKKLQGQLAGMPEIIAPDEEVSVGDIAREHANALGIKEANLRARRDLRDAKEHVVCCAGDVEKAERQLAEARKKLVAAEADAASARAAVDALVEPDLEAITNKMSTIEQTNRAVREKRARAAKAADVQAKETEAGQLTKQLAQIDASKSKLLADARFPTDGLSVDGDAVTMGGLPFSQASSAQQLRCCLAIGAALNPKLRVVLVRDGSLLDEEGLQLVAEWAEAHDMQVLMERVSDGRAAAGILIEDGEVAGEEIAPEGEPAAFPMDDFPLAEGL